MYPRLRRELVLPILRTPGSLRNKLRIVSTERFHASASSEGVKCFSVVIEFVVLALNCSLEICGGTLTETLIPCAELGAGHTLCQNQIAPEGPPRVDYAFVFGSFQFECATNAPNFRKALPYENNRLLPA
jgi:hypothetical protein